jgi:hypothetical protein
MSENDYRHIIDIMVAACGFLLAAWGRFLWARIMRLEDKLEDQTRELNQAIDNQGQIYRDEHAKLRDHMTAQHDRIIELLMENAKRAGK